MESNNTKAKACNPDQGRRLCVCGRAHTHTYKKKKKSLANFFVECSFLCVFPRLFCWRCTSVRLSVARQLWRALLGVCGAAKVDMEGSAGGLRAHKVHQFLLWCSEERRVFIEWVYSSGTVQLDHKNCSWLTLYSIMYIISLVPFSVILPQPWCRGS